MKFIRSLLLLLACLAAAPRPASATLIEAASIEQLALEADLIILGTVTHAETRMQDGRIVTDARIAAFRTWKSDPALESIVVTALGGRIGDLAQRVPGADHYEVGQNVLIFVDIAPDGTYRSARLGFSAFVVEHLDGGVVTARRQADGVVLVTNPATGALEPLPSAEPDQFELPALEEAIDATLAPGAP